MDILMRAWSYFATNILQQPAWMIGLIVLIGYILLKKPWYDVLGGTIKAVVGYRPVFRTERGNRRRGGSIWKAVFTGYDASSDCVYHQHFTGSFQ